MNYRHVYHAGNFADVLKHVVLARVIAYLRRKDQPFRFIDTHAGIGRYDLHGEHAGKTGEWKNGIDRIVSHPFDPSAAELIAPYLDAIRQINPPQELRAYPGSPLLARLLMRPGDEVVANELHPDDYLTLRSEMARWHGAKALNLDGWTALKSLLPPKERRGVVLIDPPFEQAGEFHRLADGLDAALRRFRSGVFLLWYPIKDVAAVARFRHALAGVARSAIDVRIDSGGDVGLTASGVVIVNPPFTIEDELSTIGPALARAMSQGRRSLFEIGRLSAS